MAEKRTRRRRAIRCSPPTRERRSATTRTRCAPAAAGRRCSRTSSSARRSPTSTTSASPSASSTRAVRARTATSSPTSRWARLTRAAFLQDPKKKTPVFVRFSTVAGGAGSGDTPRDVRGFAVKFYTEEGNFDLVGNNIPVFFIQDAIKFPDLIHAVKMEPDRGYPQAASRARHVLGLRLADAREHAHADVGDVGSHAAALVADDGGLRRPHLPLRRRSPAKSTFVKFHWRPKIGVGVADLGRIGQALRRRPRLAAPRPASTPLPPGALPRVRVLGAGLRREDGGEVPVRRPRRRRRSSPRRWCR